MTEHQRAEKQPLLSRTLAAIGRTGSFRRSAASDGVDALSILSVDADGEPREDGPCVAGLAGELVNMLTRRGVVLSALGPPPPEPLDEDETRTYERTIKAHMPLVERVLPLSGRHSETSTSQSSAAPGQSSIEGLTGHPDHSALFFCALLHLALIVGLPLPSELVSESSIAQQLGLRAARHDATVALIKLAVACLDWHVAIGQRIVNDGDSDASSTMPPMPNAVDPVVELLVRSCAYGYGDVRVRRAFLATAAALTHAAVDLILQLPSLGSSANSTTLYHTLFAHPAVMTAAEHVWITGIPPVLVGGRANDPTPRWVRAVARPSAMHMLQLIYSLAFAAVSVYLALSTESKHYHHINPLVPYARKSGEIAQGHARQTVFAAFVWWAYVVTAFGWAFEVHGPLPHVTIARSLPLPPGSLVVLVAYTMIALFVLLRIVSNGSLPIVQLSYTLLAWSLPFLGLATFVMPSGVPALNPSLLHRGGADTRSRSSLPDALLSQRVVTARLSGLRHLSSLLIVFALLFVISLSGEIDIYDPDLFVLPGAGLIMQKDASVSATVSPTRARVSPLEGRSAVAISIIIGAVIAWMAGGVRMDFESRRGVSLEAETASRTTTAKAGLAHLSTLDSWEASHGPVIADLARLERLRVVRFFVLDDEQLSIRMPSLPSPLNLIVLLFVEMPSTLLRLMRRRRLARKWRYSVGRVVFVALLAPQLWLIAGWRPYVDRWLGLA